LAEAPSSNETQENQIGQFSKRRNNNSAPAQTRPRESGSQESHCQADAGKRSSAGSACKTRVENHDFARIQTGPQEACGQAGFQLAETNTTSPAGQDE